jgi:uncharacterized iron-regulated membrane protein
MQVMLEEVDGRATTLWMVYKGIHRCSVWHRLARNGEVDEIPGVAGYLIVGAAAYWLVMLIMLGYAGYWRRLRAGGRRLLSIGLRRGCAEMSRCRGA